MKQESLFVPQGNAKLHLRHISQQKGGIPILMLHGAIENGKIFYTHKGKGLACYLAEQGFDVYVADFRGRGLSIPSIKEQSDHGQHHSITEDIPTLVEFVFNLTNQPMHIVCHSWGGVLFSSSLVRHPEMRDKIRTKLCFGTKRQIMVWNLERIMSVSLFWKRLAPWLSKKSGYLDAVKFKAGSDSETYTTVMDNIAWVNPSLWRDTVDDFDYAQAAKEFDWPPTWHLTGIKDHALGHAKDVQLFIDECDNKQAKFSNLSIKSGAALDYDHINILTHPLARTDHFPKITEWLKQH